MKILDSVMVSFADGTATRWSRREDDLDKASLADGNALALINTEGDVITLINPMFWMTVESGYVENEDPVRPADAANAVAEARRMGRKR